MNKRYITGKVVDIISDPENGFTRVYVKWTIDLSRLPNMIFLLNFLSNVLTEKDYNNIDPSIEYYTEASYNSLLDIDTPYHLFSFVTTAFSRVSGKDTYNEDIGYRIAFLKNQKKAIYTYNKLISVINSKINKYFKDPLEKIETNNGFDILNLRMKLNKYNKHIKR